MVPWTALPFSSSRLFINRLPRDPNSWQFTGNRSAARICLVTPTANPHLPLVRDRKDEPCRVYSSCHSKLLIPMGFMAWCLLCCRAGSAGNTPPNIAEERHRQALPSPRKTGALALY